MKEESIENSGRDVRSADVEKDGTEMDGAKGI